jgi:hypothetical protein
VSWANTSIGEDTPPEEIQAMKNFIADKEPIDD